MNGRKINILDHLAPKVGILELELRSNCESTENMVGLI